MRRFRDCIDDLCSRLFKILCIFRREKRSERKSNHKNRAPVLDSDELEFYILCEVSLNPFTVGMLLAELPLCCLNEHLLKRSKVRQYLKGNSVALKALADEFRLQKFLLHFVTPKY